MSTADEQYEQNERAFESAAEAAEARTREARLKEIRENLDGLMIPDCWHASQRLKKDDLKLFSDDVLECWHLAHDLRDDLAETRIERDSYLDTLHNLVTRISLACDGAVSRKYMDVTAQTLLSSSDFKAARAIFDEFNEEGES